MCDFQVLSLILDPLSYRQNLLNEMEVLIAKRIRNLQVQAKRKELQIKILQNKGEKQKNDQSDTSSNTLQDTINSYPQLIHSKFIDSSSQTDISINPMKELSTSSVILLASSRSNFRQPRRVFTEINLEDATLEPSSIEVGVAKIIENNEKEDDFQENDYEDNDSVSILSSKASSEYLSNDSIITSDNISLKDKYNEMNINMNTIEKHIRFNNHHIEELTPEDKGLPDMELEFLWELEFNDSFEVYDSQIFTFGGLHWRLTLGKSELGVDDRDYALMLCLLTRNVTARVSCIFQMNCLLLPTYVKACKYNLVFEPNTSSYRGCTKFISERELRRYLSENDTITISAYLCSNIDDNYQLIGYQHDSSEDEDDTDNCDLFSVNDYDKVNDNMRFSPITTVTDSIEFKPIVHSESEEDIMSVASNTLSTSISTGKFW